MRQPPKHKPLPCLLLASLLLMLASTPALATADPALYYNVRSGKYYHLDPSCALVDPKFRPMKQFYASEINHAPYHKLNPCAECVPATFIQAFMAHATPAPIRHYTQEEMNEMVAADRAIASGNFRTCSLEDKARLYPGSYSVPTPEDLQPEEALTLATQAIAATYGLSPDTLAALTPCLFFYPFVNDNNEIWHCYSIQFADEASDTPCVYGAEIISETKEIRSLESIHNTPNQGGAQ